MCERGVICKGSNILVVFDTPKYAGSSSFGMSGINAHALTRTVAAGDKACSSVTHPRAVPYEHQRCELLPSSAQPLIHAFLRVSSKPHALAAGEPTAFFQCQFSSAALAALRDHLVAAVAILPAAAMLEAAFAAGRLLGASWSAFEACSLRAASFAAPLRLDDGHQDGPSIECAVQLHSGAIQLEQGSSDGKRIFFSAAFGHYVDVPIGRQAAVVKVSAFAAAILPRQTHAPAPALAIVDRRSSGMDAAVQAAGWDAALHLAAIQELDTSRSSLSVPAAVEMAWSAAVGSPASTPIVASAGKHPATSTARETYSRHSLDNESLTLPALISKPMTASMPRHDVALEQAPPASTAIQEASQLLYAKSWHGANARDQALSRVSDDPKQTSFLSAAWPAISLPSSAQPQDPSAALHILQLLKIWAADAARPSDVCIRAPGSIHQLPGSLPNG